VRLGVYSDVEYRRDDEGLSTDRSFVLFVAALGPRLDELVLFGRLDPRPGRSPHALSHAGVKLVPLPHYSRLSDIRRVLGSVRGARAAFRRELGHLDAVWLFGPHPLAIEFARIARAQGKPVFLGVRQDFPRYVAARLPGRGWLWAVPAAHLLERAFRRLARTAPAVVVGEELAKRYRGGGAPVLATGFSLVREADVLTPRQALAREWDRGPLRLLSVGRLDPEKNPLLLPTVLARLRERDERWCLAVAGLGPLAEAVERRARELGVADALELLGYVPYGPTLRDLYRSSHALLQVSVTEGLPQVVFEAQAAGLPVVATAVGGVPAALGRGESGLLIPPDADAAAAALERLARDADLRARLVKAGLARASAETLDAQLDRLVAFFHAHLSAR
jgi:glycosyltransferase involved in cell wall biosynthesis